MSYTHLRERKYYEDIVDRITVEHGRRAMANFEKFQKKFLKLASDQPPDSHRNVLHLNWFYMLLVGNDLLERHDKRDADIEKIMASDKDKLRQVIEKVARSVRNGGVLYVSLIESEKYESVVRNDQFGERMFYYYTVQDIVEISRENFVPVAEIHEVIGHTKWFELGLKRK